MSFLKSLEIEVKKDIERIFEEKKTQLEVEAKLDVVFIDYAPIEGEFVYGEAFPFENPPRVRLEVVALDATIEEITKVLCDELIHITEPELEQYIPGTLKERKKFKNKIRLCIESS